MKNKILINAILYPNAYPWIREGLDKDRDLLNTVLKKHNMIERKMRQFNNFELRFNVLKYSINAKTIDHVVKQVLHCYADKEYMNKNVVMNILKRLWLETDLKLKKYNDLISNVTTKEEILGEKVSYLNWIVEAYIYYMCIDNEYYSEDVKNNVISLLKDKFTINDDLDGIIEEVIKKRGLFKEEVYHAVRDNMVNIKDESEELFGRIFEINNAMSQEDKGDTSNENQGLKDENDIDVDEILDIFNNSTSLIMTKKEIEEQEAQNKVAKEIEEAKSEKLKPEQLKSEEINEKAIVMESTTASDSVEELISTEESTSENNEVYMKFKKLGDSLGFKVANKDEVVVDSRKYKALENNEIKIVKKLMQSENEYILSQLYNAYENINTISKDNLEAILSTFFSNLSSLGVEVIEDSRKAGDKIEVDTKKALLDYELDRPVSSNGKVNGTILYKGWSYKGKKIMPIIVSPINK